MVILRIAWLCKGIPVPGGPFLTFLISGALKRCHAPLGNFKSQKVPPVSIMKSWLYGDPLTTEDQAEASPDSKPSEKMKRQSEKTTMPPKPSATYA